MSNIKKPTSLRGFSKKGEAPSPRIFPEAFSVLALTTATACLAATISTSTSTVALAQSAEATKLPKMKVETSAIKPKVKKKAKAKIKKKKTVSNSDSNVEQIYEGTDVDIEADANQLATDPGSNPYAQKDSPYKVNKSASGKFTEPLLNTPKGIVTVPKEVLEDKQATSIRELSRTTPGVTLGFGEGGAVFGDNLYIRGFKANNDAYIDGVRDSGTTSRESFMVEQVEILKGPSSSISGRGTTGGGLNLVTKKAQDKNFAHGGLTFGTDKTIRSTVDINQVLDPTFQVRVNGMWQNADVAGRDNVFDDRWGAAISAMWSPVSYFNVTVDYHHLTLDQMSDWGVPYNNAANKPWTETGVDRDTFYGAVGRDFQEGEQDVGTITGVFDFSKDTKLTNKFRLSRSTSDYVVSAPGGVDITDPNPDNWTAGVSYKSNHQINDIIANQTDFSTKFDTGWMKHSLVVGGELSREEVNKTGYDGLVSEDFGGGRASCSLNLFNPSYPGVGTGCWDGIAVPQVGENYTMTTIDTKSIYLLDTIKLNDQFTINGGVRLDQYDISRTGTDRRSGDPYAIGREDTMFNWNAGIVYKPAENGSIYASVATSTNPMGQEIEGGGGDYGGLDANAEVLAPEENIAFELGTKWELFNKNLLLTAAVFQTTKDKAREGTGRGLPYEASGKYRVRGIELGFAGKVTDAWSIYGGAVFMDSEILESNNENNVGEKLANISHNSFNLLTKYQLTNDLTVGGQATYQGTIGLGTLAQNGRKLPTSWRFDLLAEYKLLENMDLQLNVQNVFDEIVYDSGYRSGSPFVYVASGRAAYLNLKMKY